MKDAAIAELHRALDVVENNAPINEASGNVDQAKLERDEARRFRSALAVLEAA